MISLFHLDEMSQIQNYTSIRYILRILLKEAVFSYHVYPWFYYPRGCFCNQNTETEAETQIVLWTFSILFGKGTTQDEPRFNNKVMLQHIVRDVQ